jgi:D-alanyl-D-alanine carboxypeptidase (penicillin-binding protein 5/6)
MARLLTAIFRDFPEYKAFMAEQEFTYNGIKQQNRNRLLSTNVGIDASKTGHTQESGYHLASTAGEPYRDPSAASDRVSILDNRRLAQAGALSSGKRFSSSAWRRQWGVVRGSGDG